MTAIRLDMTMSLDGFIGDRDDGLDWAFAADGGPSGLGSEVIATCGAFLCGGRRIDAVGENRPYGGKWQGPVLVYTHKDPARLKLRTAEGLNFRFDVVT